MKEPRDPGPIGDTSVGEGRKPEVRDDLRALRSVSDRELPELDTVVREARLRQERRPARWEEWLMSNVQGLKRRPWVVSAVAVVAIAMALLVIPISYQRTTGHQVEVSLARGDLGMDATARIARQLKAVLGADHVVVRSEQGSAGQSSVVLSAFVRARSGASAASLAQAFANGLAAKGYVASATSRPVKERVSGSVYAYARDQMITINADGKSAAELEAEIRQRLAEAGVPDASVSVTDEPNGSRKLKIEVQRHHDGMVSGSDEAVVPQLQITKNGAPVTGQAFEVRVLRKKSESGMILSVTVTAGDKTATAEVENPEALGDAAVSAQIESQLEKAGIQARVSVNGGRIEVEPR